MPTVRSRRVIDDAGAAAVLAAAEQARPRAWATAS